MKAIYGLYSDPESVECAVNSLSRAGVSGKNIEVVSSQPFEQFEFTRQHGRTWMPWLAGLGGLVGGILAYSLVSFTQRAFPIRTGGMAIVPLWTDGIIMYELTMLGAILTTLVTFVVSAKLLRGRKQLYDEAVAEGQILVGILEPPASSQAALEKLLRESGAREVKAAGE